jgi:hypothetical protein
MSINLAAPARVDFSTLAQTGVKGFWDALCKFFKGEIRGGEFAAYVGSLGKTATFERAFASRNDLASKLGPLLNNLDRKLTTREGREILDLLKIADAGGITVAMAACLNPQTRAPLGNLIGKLSPSQQQELLQQKTTGNPPLSLYAYVAANTSKEPEALQEVATWHADAHLQVDNGEIISVLAQQDITPDTSTGLGVGGKPLEHRAKDGVTRLAKMCDAIKFNTATPLTAEQVGAFFNWFNESTTDTLLGNELSNADIFIAALGGNDFERNSAKAVLDALYAYDSGNAMRKFLFAQEYFENYLDDADCTLHGIADYALERCFPEASRAALLEYYTKCGLTEGRAAIEAKPNVGASLSKLGVGQSPKDWNAVTAASVNDNKIKRPGGNLMYEVGSVTYGCCNIRQLAQFPNLSEVTIYSCMQNITAEDLKHLFIEAKNLKTVTIRSLGEALVTPGMANGALEQAKEDLRRRGDTRELDIQIVG